MPDASLKESPYENRFHYRTLAVINRLQAKQSRWFADFMPGRKVGQRTLRYRSACRPVLGFWRSEKTWGFASGKADMGFLRYRFEPRQCKECGQIRCFWP